jgi:hypothetical protein
MVLLALLHRVQVSRLEQRILAVTADNEVLQSELDSARHDADRARDSAAATSAGDGLARLPRDKWPLPVLMLVQAAEAAAVTDIAEKHVSAFCETVQQLRFLTHFCSINTSLFWRCVWVPLTSFLILVSIWTPMHTPNTTYTLFCCSLRRCKLWRTSMGVR